MSRRPRGFFPGGSVHVIQRGNNRQRIFGCEADFRLMWRYFREAAEPAGLDINAYVFMPNHVHFLVTPAEPDSISKVMHSATRRYATYFNKRYRRTGTLWEGRFRACMITSDTYFLNCHRYIDMNPVRAGIVSHPADYEWSSHRVYTHGESNSLVTRHYLIAGMAEDERGRRRAYGELVGVPLLDDELSVIRGCTHSGRPMGEMPRRAGRPRKKIEPGTNF